MINERKTKIAESLITNINSLGILPAEEIKLNTGVIYQSILSEICTVMPINSFRGIVSSLRLDYDNMTSVTDNKSGTLMNTVSAMPLDDSGNITNVVRLTLNENTFMCSFKNIIRNSIEIKDNNEILYIDDGEGNIINKETKDEVGTVDYITAIFDLTINSNPYTINYKYDNLNLPSSRNTVKFIKQYLEVFAELYEIDLDVALVIDQFKGLDLEKDIENIIQVVTQQIDTSILNKYFEHLALHPEKKAIWDAGNVDWNNTTKGYSVTDFFSDFGTYVGLEMSKFTDNTGVIPNIILCDNRALNVLSSNKNYITLINLNDEKEKDYSGTPKKVGKFLTADVYLVQHNTNATNEGDIVITYNGAAENQTAGTFTVFIPVTLRKDIIGMESGGMIKTNNAYSVASFILNNPELVTGVKIINI